MGRKSMAQNHKEEIVTAWRQGALVTALAAQEGSDARTIRRIIIAAVGAETYKRVNASRTGAAAAKRRTKPHYPKWM